MPFLLNVRPVAHAYCSVVVATELAQQEEANGDSTEKVKLEHPLERHAPVDIRSTLD
jgi:hypothetical protein